MSSTETGLSAESKVVDYLKTYNFKIIDKNWRNKWCEIDIIARKDSIVYFIEVKYRSSEEQGDGFAYITNTKIKQMTFASEVWVSQNNWEGEYILSAASVNNAGQVDFISDIFS